ncbi:hypothetical protein SISSUDRAFT_1051613 [Sistotremastrum suecicum HHB10207 ss-3]|uniref:Uncharacterized protein n=1 Tax=Sistotremastrum suecicum HHB10207 ss-3 TaxID=1314776 RepID=A0A166AFT7_9AGAM|nr:hypothetical protein SISSUDRAFT_1051613 [Sistotremastrum suecicum HHB10207 ss-3]
MYETRIRVRRQSDYLSLRTGIRFIAIDLMLSAFLMTSLHFYELYIPDPALRLSRSILDSTLPALKPSFLAHVHRLRSVTSSKIKL